MFDAFEFITIKTVARAVERAAEAYCRKVEAEVKNLEAQARYADVMATQAACYTENPLSAMIQSERRGKLAQSFNRCIEDLASRGS